MSVKTQYDPIIQIEREAQPPHSHHQSLPETHTCIPLHRHTGSLALFLLTPSLLLFFPPNTLTTNPWVLLNHTLNHSVTQSPTPSLPLLFPPSHNRTCSKPQTGRQHGFEVLYEKEGGHCHDGLGKRRKDTPTRRETARPSDEGKELVGDWRKLRVVYKWQSQDTRCHDM